MVQTTISSENIEYLDKPVGASYRRRNKIASVNMLYDSPFALERQLEDQRIQIERNKNPQVTIPTKATKHRSEKLITQKINSPVSNKVVAINKIVREASGVHTYALMPPLHDDLRVNVNIHDPETHPVLQPYRDQVNRMPVMASFGHRPKSASRTFNPATMKIRLKHGEVTQPLASGKSNFGMPAALLAQLLHCPKLEAQSEPFSAPASSSIMQPSDLFLSPEEMSFVTSKPSKTRITSSTRSTHSTSLRDITIPKAITSSERYLNKSKSMGKSSNFFVKEDPIEVVDDKPDWDGRYSSTDRSNEVFQLRLRRIDDSKTRSVKERLNRFTHMAASESMVAPFCAEKRETDRLLAAGKPPPRARASVDPYRDAAVEAEIKNILQERIEKEKRLDRKLQRVLRAEELGRIAKSDYDPDKVLNQLQNSVAVANKARAKTIAQMSGGMEWEPVEEGEVATPHRRRRTPMEVYGPSLGLGTRGSSRSPSKSRSGLGTMGSTNVGGISMSDSELTAAIEATKNGDADALFNFFMHAASLPPPEEDLQDSLRGENESAGSTVELEDRKIQSRLGSSYSNRLGSAGMDSVAEEREEEDVEDLRAGGLAVFVEYDFGVGADEGESAGDQNVEQAYDDNVYTGYGGVEFEESELAGDAEEYNDEEYEEGGY